MVGCKKLPLACKKSFLCSSVMKHFIQCWILMLSHRVAKEKKLRVWKNYQPATSAMPVIEKAYVAKVL